MAETDTPLALYKRIEGEIRRQIESAMWPVGGMLPSRRDLAKQYRVSTLTVERAIDGLVREGLLRCDDRRGTFVSAQSARFEKPVVSESPATIGIVATIYPLREEHLALNNHWVRLIVQAIEGDFAEPGESTRFFNRAHLDGNADTLQQTLSRAVQQPINGLVVVGFAHDPQEVDESLTELSGLDLPTVVITSGALKRPVPHIFLGQFDAGYQAGSHLFSQGCREILFLSPFSATWCTEREEGVRAAAEHAGLPSSAVRLFPQDAEPWVNESDPVALGYDAAMRAFRSQEMPVGIVSANDGAAFGFLQAAQELGREAGRDFLLVGFDDHPESRIRHLTSLRPAMEEMGREAARLLRLAIAGRQGALQTRLRWNLIPRSSSLPARALAQ